MINNDIKFTSRNKSQTHYIECKHYYLCSIIFIFTHKFYIVNITTIMGQWYNYIQYRKFFFIELQKLFLHQTLNSKNRLLYLKDLISNWNLDIFISLHSKHKTKY